MSDTLDDVQEGWLRGSGPASEPPRTVIEVIHLARDRLMKDFGLEEKDDEDEGDEEGEVDGDQGNVANRPLPRASRPTRRTDVEADADADAGPSRTTRSRTKTCSPTIPRIAVIAPTPKKPGRSKTVMQDEGEEEVNELVDLLEGSDRAIALEEFDFRPFLQSPAIPSGWFPWQDESNVVHYRWEEEDTAPHELVEGVYDSCKVLLKQNVQDSWEQVELDRFFKTQNCLRCRKLSRTCIPPKSSEGIVTCVTCKSSSQGCSHNSMVPLVAVMKKFGSRISIPRILRLLHGLGWVSFDGVKIVNAFFKSVPKFPKLPIRTTHPPFTNDSLASPASSSQIGVIPNPSSGPTPGDAIRSAKRKGRGARITIPRPTPSLEVPMGVVSEESLCKRRALDVERPKKPAKRLRKRSSVLIDSEAVEAPEEEEEDPVSYEMALDLAGDDPQDFQVVRARVGGCSDPQGVVTDRSAQEYCPSGAGTPATSILAASSSGSVPRFSCECASASADSLEAIRAECAPRSFYAAESPSYYASPSPVAPMVWDLTTPSPDVSPTSSPMLTYPSSKESSIQPLERLIPRKFYDEATTEVNMLRIQLAEEVRKRQEAEKKLVGSRADFLFMSQASRMAVNASDIMVEIATKSKEVDTMVRQVVDDLKKREWQDEEPLEGVMPVFLEVKELRKELAGVKEELAETEAQLEAVRTAGASEAESSVKRLESELDRLKNRDEINNHQLQNALAGGAKLALTSMHDVLPILFDTTNELTSSFNTLSEAVNGLPSESRNAVLGRLRPFKDSAQRVHRLIQSLHNVFRSECNSEHLDRAQAFFHPLRLGLYKGPRS
ncbi:hypothetical protein V5O48_013479 [Marasmius crinis-equi]|uniref:Uncharacterized protein n=1 Tax=Marasmius crinis-equi TaxID=585013 RepID=A0ABR3EZX9_9AGAR